MKKVSVLILAILSLALLVGCKATEREVNQSDIASLGTAFSGKGNTLSDPASIPQKGQLTPNEAKTVAFKHAQVNAKEVYKIEVELDGEDAIPHYDISFKSGGVKYEYEIHAETAEILEQERERTMGRSGIHTITISQDKAKATVFAHAGVQESAIQDLEIKLDQENAKVVYEIEFHSGAYEYEYEIDAQSGAILKFRRDR